jgi:hypothetical protein
VAACPWAERARRGARDLFDGGGDRPGPVTSLARWRQCCLRSPGSPPGGEQLQACRPRVPAVAARPARGAWPGSQYLIVVTQWQKQPTLKCSKHVNKLGGVIGTSNPQTSCQQLPVIDMARPGKCAGRKHTRGGFHVPQEKRRPGQYDGHQRVAPGAPGSGSGEASCFWHSARSSAAAPNGTAGPARAQRRSPFVRGNGWKCDAERLTHG